MEILHKLFKRITFLFISLLLWASSAFGQDASDNLFVFPASGLCEGRVAIITPRYSGGNLISDYLWVQYKGSDGNWHTFFSTEHWMDDGNKYSFSPYYSGLEDQVNYEDGDGYYAFTYYFNPNVCDQALYNTIIKFRAIESTDNTISSNDSYYYTDGGIESWKPKSILNVSVSNEEYCDKIHVSWDACSNIDGNSGYYRIYDGGFYYNAGTNTSYDITGLPQGTTKDIQIQYVADCGNSGFWSNAAAGKTKPYGDPPSGLAATNDLCNNKVNLTWSWNLTNPSNFKVYRGTTLIANLDGDKRSFEYTPPAPETAYNYRVSATDVCGTQNYSGYVSGTGRNTPAAPTFNSAVVGVSDITLNWTDNSNNETDFIIERNNTELATVAAGIQTFIDDQADPCITYTYRIKAKNDCAPEGIASATSFSRKIGPDISQAFTSAKQLVCSKGYYNDKIMLKWTNNNENIIERYKIFRREFGSGESFTLITSLDPTSTYIDETAEAGIYYEYKIMGEVPCENDILSTPETEFSNDIGFRVPVATVSGSVTFEGGSAVRDVSIIAETEDSFPGNSLLFDGIDDYVRINDADFSKFDFDTAFTFQAWIKPTSSNTGDIFRKGTQYQITHSPGVISFNAGGQTLSLNFTKKTDTFFCINAVRDADSLYLYIMYDNQTVWKASTLFTGTTPANTNDIYLAGQTNYFKGNIEEIRFWGIPLSEVNVLKTSFRYINGNETGISSYYHFNEMFNETVYDISRSNSRYYENHGYCTASLSADIPFSKQISVKGITDENGNYLITGIPYTFGSVYEFVPVYKSHEFNPNKKSLYIGPGSNAHSGVDFMDIAAFKIQGNLVYKDTYFPVAGAQVYIDGQAQIRTDGSPILTDNMGNYSVYVPIGWHNLSLGKHGHVLRDNGRFPADENLNHNFQASFSNLNFVDTTLIKVIGKVAGGPVQAAKPIGLGKTLNNIGHTEIVMTTQKGYDLAEGDSSWTILNQSYEDDLLIDDGTTNLLIDGLNPKTIKISPDQATGEFTAYLLPEKYTISNVSAGTYIFGDEFKTTIDLSNRFLSYTEIDEVPDPQSGDTAYVRTDSVQYNYKHAMIYRVLPSVDVKNHDKENRFWDDSLTAKDDNKVCIINPDQSPKTLYPVFTQRKKYDLNISVFEEYTNANTGNVDLVPVTDGELQIQNFLAINTNKISLPIDQNGEADYSFFGGLPNITVGGIGDYIKTMSIIAKTGNNGSINTAWLPGGESFKAYIIGGMPTGNNFVSTGPSQIITILRDPPGSNSSAFLEEGTSIHITTETSVSNETASSINCKIDLGAKVVTFAGLGAGVITTTETIADVNIGLDMSSTVVDNSKTTSAITNTQKWSTSSNENFVGSGGDVFVGYSTNIVYGISTQIDLIPLDMPQGSNFVGNPFDYNSVTYDIGMSKGIRINPEFGTMFQYSLNHIESYLLPNLSMLRNNYLTNQPDMYQCVICDKTSELYGLPNTTGELTAAGWIGGDSYNFTVPASWPSDSLFVDSVEFFNKQIDQWEQALAFNEKEKVDALLEQNVSFDGGSIYENTQSNQSSEESTFTSSFNVSPKVGEVVGVEILGLGTTWTVESKYSYTETTVDGYSTARNVTSGYTLSDGNAGDYLSVDVKTPATATGPVFITRGGQTMCPFEGGEFTKYYLPGTSLSESTMQREVPQIECENPIAIDVPEDGAAVFNVQIRNVSESNDDQWFILSIDESSNQNGALIKMDGAPIGNGRMILVHAGQSYNKTITVQKVQPDVYDYENLRLILHSPCQFDPTDFQENIADSVQLTAYFQPVCSPISMYSPENQWIVNTNGDSTLTASISDYNLAHGTFDNILFQYKAASSSNWSTDMIFYTDSANWSTIPEPKTFIDGAPSMNYSFNLKDMPDRNYDIKLTSNCSDGTKNNSVIASGIKDVKRPKLFGSPQPADGILSPNDEIMITFDENVYAGGLTPYNFSIRGVINEDNELRHKSCVYFDGINDYASVVSGVNLDNSSFTIEFWTRKAASGEGVIFSQGDIEIGFTASDKFYLKMGSFYNESDDAYTDLNSWMHFSAAYSAESNMINIYYNDQILREAMPLTSGYNGTGRMYIGKSAADDKFYDGFIHDFRIWENFRGFGTTYANMLKVHNGNEVGIAGLWSMDEAYGDYAADKARSHNALLVGAEWKVFPAGYAKIFDGAASHLDFNTGSSVVISNQMDFTVEFWFKGRTQANSVLFSNGNDNFTSQSPPYENVWVIGTNAEGEIYAKNNGSSITAADENFTDNSWHHLALVINRIGNTTLYIDGELKNYEQSSVFGGLSGADMTIGARRHYLTVSQTNYDNYFSGNIDELRIWNLAKPAKQIKMDMNCKLKGTEMGLLAYYPFDIYNDLGIDLIPSLSDITGEAPNATETACNETNTDVPNIKDARPVQELAFSWVVNEDQIIINVNEQADAIEKCILEFTADRVEDMRENRMASPVTWTAYIKQNEVIWEGTQLYFTKLINEEMSFSVNIQNIGGTDQTYEITNLPPWLSASETEGTLAPDSYKTIQFTVDPVVNIGTHDLSLFLTSDFGYAEKLGVNLKVYKEKPDWTVDEGDYQYTMSVIGQLKIDGKLSINPDDMVGAFVKEGNTEVCRGTAFSVYIQDYDMFEVYLNIYSNSENGENVYFKIRNASEGYIHVNVSPEVDFQYNEVIGTPRNPQILESFNSYSFESSLAKGWTWLSFNLENIDFSDVNLIMENVSASTGDQIKTQAAYANYDETSGWDGSLLSKGGFDNKSMYMFKMKNADTLKYWGSKLSTYNIEIPIVPGLNWISYTANVNMTVNDALGNYQPANEDIIKNQYAFAMYDQNMGWIGSLQYMVPGQGYIYKTTNPEGILTYPASGLNKSSIQSGKGYNELIVNDWNFTPENYQFSNSTIAELMIDSVTENHLIGAFSGDECRGIAESQYIENLGKRIYFLTAFSNLPEQISFKMTDISSKQTYEINETLDFTPHAVLGSLENPVRLTLSATAVNEFGKTSEYFISNYPNPFSNEITITYGLPKNSNVTIEIFDILGQKIKTISNRSNSAGIHTTKWNGTNHQGVTVANGMYLLKITCDDFIKTNNIIKQ